MYLHTVSLRTVFATMYKYILLATCLTTMFFVYIAQDDYIYLHWVQSQMCLCSPENLRLTMCSFSI